MASARVRLSVRRRESDSARLQRLGRCSLKARIHRPRFEWMSDRADHRFAYIFLASFACFALSSGDGKSAKPLQANDSDRINRADQRKSLDKIIAYHYTWLPGGGGVRAHFAQRAGGLVVRFCG